MYIHLVAHLPLSALRVLPFHRFWGNIRDVELQRKPQLLSYNKKTETAIWAIDTKEGQHWVVKSFVRGSERDRERGMLLAVASVQGVLHQLARCWSNGLLTPFVFERGTPLQVWLASRPIKSIQQTLLHMAKSLVATLQQVHACGVVHCDVKPSNIIVLDQAGAGTAYLNDFGCAVSIEQVDKENMQGEVERVAAWRGTRRYLSTGALLLESPRPQHDLESLLISLHTLAFPKERRCWDLDVEERPVVTKLDIDAEWYTYLVEQIEST